MICRIKSGTITEVVEISKRIPEFDHPHEAGEYARRMHGKKHLILVAYIDDKPAGFKVAYDKQADGSLYSWMGGVLPEFRRHQVARQLADAQEAWAKENGFSAITFKTRNRHKAMLIFSLTNGFQIIAVEPGETIAENRIILTKNLIS